MKQHNTENMLIGSSKIISSIRNSITFIANSNQPVLISGEIGTGKYLVAELINIQDKNSPGDLTQFNCLAVPPRLHADIIFGFIDEKGKENAGLLEGKTKYSLLIENLEKLSEEAQSGILSIILNGSYYLSGGRKPQKADIRVIATTDKDIHDLASEDFIIPKLLKEISEIQISLPPLRERMEDIPMLVENYINRISKELGKSTPVIPPELIEKYISQEWNGNVSQLISSIRTLLLATDGNEIDVTITPNGNKIEIPDILYNLYKQFREKSQTLKEFRNNVEGIVIKIALEEANYNAAKVGRKIGMSEAGMRRAMERLGILTKRQRKTGFKLIQ